MGQPYRRSVSTEGGLSVPIQVDIDQALTATITDNSYTYAQSAQVDIWVEGADAICQVASDATPTWSADRICPVGMTSLPSTHYGIRLRNRAAGTATVGIWRFTS